MSLGGIFDFDTRKERLVEVERELEDPKVWDNPERAQELGRERVSLAGVVNTIETLDKGLADARELLDMAVEEQDADTVEAVREELDRLNRELEEQIGRASCRERG